MNLAFITPTAYLDKFSKKGDFYLALAHLIDDNGENEYSRFHRREIERGKKVILDNGLFEGSQVAPEALIQRCRAIGAQTVCAPDSLYDSRGTIKEFKRFIKLKQEEGLCAEIMGIPQADNPTDWWECFQFMELHKECNLIGLSILSIPKAFGRVGEKRPITSARVNLIKQLYRFESFLGRRAKQCHLLGLGENYADVHIARRLLPQTIVSNDSSSAFVHGMHEKGYGKNGSIPGGKILKKLDFEIANLTEKQERYINYNINVARKVAHGNSRINNS